MALHVTPQSGGRTERRLATIVLITALVPLVVAVSLANALFKRAAAIWFDPEVGRQLDRGVDVYKDYVRAVKDDMRHQTDAIAADEVLQGAAKNRNVELLESELDAVFPRFPELVSVAIEEDGGETLARRDRGAAVDASKERSLVVRRPLSDAGGTEAVVATFAVRRERLDELEKTGPLVTRYHQLEASRAELYRGYLQAFAALLGITILATLALGTVLARGVTRRIRRLAAAIKVVAKGDLSVRVPVTGSDELTDLARTFNTMLTEMEGSRSRIEYLQRIGAWQEMARRLAHEIKNPLTPIQLAVQECHRKYGGGDPRFRALLDTTLEIVEEEVGTLRRLVGDFSNFARLPRAELRRENLRAFVRECGEQLGHLETGEGLGPPIQVRWEARDEGAPLDVRIDRQMLRRVVVNLVENAAQAIAGARALGTAKPGAGTVIVRAVGGEGHVGLIVEDDGPGVEKEACSRVFDPYFTTKPTGTGLGLAIVKKVIVEHGGTVSVGASEILGGAKFTILLPLPDSELGIDSREAEATRAREEARAAGALVDDLANPS